MADGQHNIIQAVKTYGKRLFSFIRQRVGTDEDAEDILQDVWYRYTNTSEKEIIDQVSAWLFRVARNLITDKYRKHKEEFLEDQGGQEEHEGPDFLDILLPKDANDPETELLRQLFWQQLFNALDELPGNQRDVFIWNELEGKTFAQISGETGENIKTLISRKGYAVKHLRRRLETLYDELINY